MDNRPIGVFDSGVGGLTAMKELMRILPHEDIVYFGDTARVPYGSHSPETIVKFAKQDLGFLLSQNVKAVLIACGTVSSTAINDLRRMTSIPIVGVIGPAAQKAVELSKRKKVIVLATKATIKSHAYSRAIVENDGSFEVIEKACPLFVPLIENGYRDNPVTKMVVRDYLEEMLPFDADVVVLGCTHYPLIKGIICDVLPGIKAIESGKEAAIELSKVLEEKKLCNSKKSQGIRKYFVSEKTESFKVFMDEDLDETIVDFD